MRSWTASGLDAAYRARTGCTLYTLEMHMHYLHEVKQTDTAAVARAHPGRRRTSAFTPAFELDCARA